MTSDDNFLNYKLTINSSGNISNIMIINYAHPKFCSSQGHEKQNVKMRTKYVVEEMNSIKRI